MNLESKIEAVLFYRNEPVSFKKLAKILNTEEEKVVEGLNSLSHSLEGRGLCLIMTDTEASLATAPGMKYLLEEMAKDEMKSEIGKAGLETLAIILYNGPVSRREIDYVRGVNSSFILRNLGLRGLIEKSDDPKDGRQYKYKPTISLFAHLGIKGPEELPEYRLFKQKMLSGKENIQNEDGQT